jgi:CRP-like cAMP-binding protein
MFDRFSNICYTLQFPAGSTIVRENDLVKYVYFIQSGTCEISTSLEVDINQEIKNIIEMYSGYGSKYYMPKFTDPYGRRIITQSFEEKEPEVCVHQSDHVYREGPGKNDL